MGGILTPAGILADPVLFGNFGGLALLVKPMTHIWFWKAKLGERNGELCRVLCRGKLNSALVEFADGFRVVTSRYAVRREIKKPQPFKVRALL